MAVMVAVTMALAALAVTPSLLFYFDVTPKAAVALWGAAVALPWLAASGLRGLRATRCGRWFTMLLAAAAVWTALATAFSVRPQLSFVGTNWRRFGLPEQIAVLVLAAAAGEAAARGGARTILRAMAATGIPIALYAMLQYSGRDPWLPAAAYHVGTGEWTIVRPPGTLGHAAYLANWLLLAVFAGVALWLTEERAWWRRLGLLAAAAGSAAIVMSGTRAGIAGLAAGAALLWFWMGRRVSQRGLAVLAAVAVAAPVFYYSPAGQPLRSRSRWYVEDAWGGARLRLWRDSAAMALRHTAFGTGPETFTLVFPHAESAELAAAYPDFYHESPHNLFLDAWTAAGFPAMAVLAALYALALGCAWRFRPHEPHLTGALAAAVCAALVSHQFSVLIVPTALVLYCTLALMVGLGAKPAPGTPNRAALLALTAAVAAAVAFWGAWLVAADRRQLATQTALRRGRIAEAVYDAAQALMPFDRLWYSAALEAAARESRNPLVRLGAEQEALAAGLRAARESDNPQNAWYRVAMLRAAKNDFAGTERALQEAIAAAPNWFKPHWALARLLRLAGRTEEARREALAAARLNRKDPEVARTLAEMAPPVKAP